MFVYLVLILVMSQLTMPGGGEPGATIGNPQNVTVSAGIPAEQIQAERTCDRLIRDAEAMIGKGDNTNALELLKDAWELCQKHAFLQGRRSTIVRDRGRAHSGERNFQEALGFLRERLELEKRSCELKSQPGPYAEVCGEAYMDLGIAEFFLADYSTAAAHFKEAAACYEIWIEKGSDSNQLFKIGYRIHLGEATALAGVATERQGDKTGAGILLERAIKILETAQNNPVADERLRAAASQALTFAKRELSAIK